MPWSFLLQLFAVCSLSFGILHFHFHWILDCLISFLLSSFLPSFLPSFFLPSFLSFFLSLFIYFLMANRLFIRMLINVYEFVGFSVFLFLLTSRFNPWLSHRIDDVISVSLYLLLALWLNVWPVLEKDPWGAKKKVYSLVFGWNIL